MLKKLYYKIRLAWHGLFYGMSGAEKVINTPGACTSDSVEIIQQQTGGGVFADMLEEKQTQQVKETVDAYYRIFREADKIDTSSIRIIGEDDEGVIFAPITNLKKKTFADFIVHAPVFNPDDAKIRTIQDNFHLEDKYNYNPALLYKYDTTLTVTRDNFTPRFEIDKIVKKMVVRECDNNKAMVDLYLPSEASQFGKIDAIIVSQLHELLKTKNYNSDLIDFTEIEWVSDKAWNTENMLLFKYKVLNLIGINKYDGSIVLTYLCEIIEDGKDLTEKYKTKELDEKYAIEAPKKETIDIFTYERKLNRDKEKNNIDLNNLTSSKIEIK
jgi:hypothetical protein